MSAWTPEKFIAVGLDPAKIFTMAGHTADPWQEQVLRSNRDRIILNCSRQAGKSTTVAALATHEAVFKPGSMILLLSRAQRQATELFRKFQDFYNAMGRPVRAIAESLLRIELENGSRIIALPGLEANIRAYSGVTLLVIDEAARVSDELYRAVRPMLAVSNGRLILLSTPFGKRGFFYEEWVKGEDDWLRIETPATLIPRISKQFLEGEKAALGKSWFEQEYLCSFEALEGLVYPEFRQCLVDFEPKNTGKQVGGIDFGFRNPFAAVWGFLDHDDVLWITNERYERLTPLSEHAKYLPRKVRWYADPAGANDIAELRCANFAVSRGDNGLRAGIAAVTSRIQTGRLKVVASRCPNLIAEAGLYRYPRPGEEVANENPVDENNHALAGLRYLISRIDKRFMAAFRKTKQPNAQQEAGNERAFEQNTDVKKPARNHWMDPRNPALWSAVD